MLQHKQQEQSSLYQNIGSILSPWARIVIQGKEVRCERDEDESKLQQRWCWAAEGNDWRIGDGETRGAAADAVNIACIYIVTIWPFAFDLLFFNKYFFPIKP
jgi:hypothetical protein